MNHYSAYGPVRDFAAITLVTARKAAAFVKSEVARWGGVIRKAGIAAE